MAWCTLSFNSTVLRRPEKIEVLIPQDGFKRLRQKDDFSVLFILHGLHKDRKSGCWTPSCPSSCGSCRSSS